MYYLVMKITLSLSNKFGLHPAFAHILLLNFFAVLMILVKDDTSSIWIMLSFGSCSAIAGLNILFNPILRKSERKVQNQNHIQKTPTVPLRRNSELNTHTQAKAKYCSQCGNNLGLNSKFCSSCGSQA